MKEKVERKRLNIDKKALIVGGSLLLAVLLVGLAIGISNSKHKKDVTAREDVACNAFASATAEKLLGPDFALKSNVPSSSSSNDISVSTCTYSQPGATVSNDKLTASITVRTPLTDAGIASNKKAFKSKSIRGFPYGVGSYWAPDTGQLNVLGHNGTWYSLSFGAVNPLNRSLGQTGQLAILLSDKINLNSSRQQ